MQRLPIPQKTLTKKKEETATTRNTHHRYEKKRYIEEKDKHGPPMYAVYYDGGVRREVRSIEDID